MQRLGGILFLVLAFGSLPFFAQKARPCDGSLFGGMDREPGIGKVMVPDQRERLQIWLDPERLAAHDLTPAWGQAGCGRILRG